MLGALVSGIENTQVGQSFERVYERAVVVFDDDKIEKGGVLEMGSESVPGKPRFQFADVGMKCCNGEARLAQLL